ncbi:AtpZ/AtpI family protein [Proteocatella sphenisci]|uniref:AtpZ/AtpI family protein n=1 Tax=Proteocatella sphenisci TaxID=181070 RepID=UPI000490AEC1|nr:AtpZ/AtpI family protein [Proteocatella sphenisci]
MKDKKSDHENELIDKVDQEVKTKIKMQKSGSEVMFGLGAFGIVGWSITVPVVAGILSGRYLDEKYTQSFSWTLVLLFTGLIIGCLNAWYWIKKNGPQ